MKQNELIIIIFLSLQLPLSGQILSSMSNPKSYYFIDFKGYTISNELPIGVFDSGTGGLTVLDAIVSFDAFRNKTNNAEKDGKPDFLQEKFIYLADQANMPYGNYVSAGRQDLLEENVMKDVQFMLSSKYYKTHESIDNQNDKQKIKVLVIACNTATAYGQKKIEEYFNAQKFPLKVIGVIEAGAKGALQTFTKEESGSVAVFATSGTVSSQSYEKAVRRLQKEMNYSGKIALYSQGGVGIAESLDQDPNFIRSGTQKPYQNYKGPSFQNQNLLILKQLLKIYNFNFFANQMLCDSQNSDDCENLQLNSPENYVRFHIVSLLEKMRESKQNLPLKTIILGCTHYPYISNDIQKVLDELRKYKENEEYRYRNLLSENIILIDPALNTAKELYKYLIDNQLFNSNESPKLNQSEFYISVPNPYEKSIKTDSSGKFTYEYKYGRNLNLIERDTKIVPFSQKNIPSQILQRLSVQIPTTYQLIQNFNENSKFKNLTSEK